MPDHELIRLIGHGSYGEVWLARNVLGMLRAVKVVFRGTFTDARPYEREFSGILLVEPLSRSHEGLVDILHVGRHEPEGYFYYVMELADDVAESPHPPTLRPPDLAGYRPRTLARELKYRGRLPFEQCVQLGLTLSSALSYIHHGGLVHRDVKPSNILYVGGVAKLGDIGLVEATGESASYVGTEGYIPPEGPGTPQADVFGLGKVLYEASTGRDRLEFPALPADLGDAAASAQLAELNAVFLRACAPDPRERYQSAEELHADLALLHRGQSVRRQRRMDRRWRYLTQAGLALAALLGVAIGAWWSPRHPPGSGAAANTAPAVPATQQTVDLSRFYNVNLSSNWTHDFPGNNLASLPAGRTRLGPAQFAIGGLVQLSGGFLESRNLVFPPEIQGVPVNRLCARLFFLHGSVWQADMGATVGNYVIHYADGRRAEIPLRYGDQLQNWWWSPSGLINAKSASLAWTGTNAAIATASAESRLCLYAIEWNNPFPAARIATIDFISTRSPACPFLVAVTSE